MSHDSPPEDSLIQAVRLKSISSIQQLMQLNVDINCEGMFGSTPLKAAVTDNDMAMIELLIAYGADVNYHSSSIIDAYPTALRLAAGRRAPRRRAGRQRPQAAGPGGDRRRDPQSGVRSAGARARRPR